MADRARGVGLAVACGLLAGFIAGVGVALWTNDSQGGSAAAEWVVALVVGLAAFGVTLPALTRAGGRGLLGAPRRMAGGVGQESATANPDETTVT